jgi:hypothetical protein
VEEGLRRIPLSRRSHIIGFQPLATGIVEHESALERDFVTLTSFLDAHASITSQPITLTFQDAGRARRYTPDYLVRWSDLRTELIEIKYQADLDANQERLLPAFAVARAWASEFGASFRTVTEHDIRGPVLKNVQRLLPLRDAPLDAESAARVLAAARSLEAPTFGGVLEELRAHRLVALATLWRLIARGALRVDLSAPIGFDTHLCVP